MQETNKRSTQCSYSNYVAKLARPDFLFSHFPPGPSLLLTALNWVVGEKRDTQPDRIDRGQKVRSMEKILRARAGILNERTSDHNDSVMSWRFITATVSHSPLVWEVPLARSLPSPALPSSTSSIIAKMTYTDSKFNKLLFLHYGSGTVITVLIRIHKRW